MKSSQTTHITKKHEAKQVSSVSESEAAPSQVTSNNEPEAEQVSSVSESEAAPIEDTAEKFSADTSN